MHIHQPSNGGTPSYSSPRFTSFLISGQATVVEVGDTIATPQDFTWTFVFPGNITANTMAIIDVTAGNTVLSSGLSLIPPHNQALGVIQLNTVGSYSWKGRATNTHAVQFFSSNFTINWEFLRFWGGSTMTSLPTGADIQALANSELAANFNQQKLFPAGANYEYFSWPDSFGSPAAGNGFHDPINNFNVAMAKNTDDAFFSNVQNGWYYGLVAVTNTNGITTNYRVYRTKNILNGGLTILVQ